MIQIFQYGAVPNEQVFARVEPKVNVEATVAQIIEQVCTRGDAALYEYCKKFDGADLDSLQVTQQELDDAFASVEPEFISVLQKAAANIRKFHEKQVRTGFVLEEKDGVIMGQKTKGVNYILVKPHFF